MADLRKRGSRLHVYGALDGAVADVRRKWVRVDGAPASNGLSFSEVASESGIPEEIIAILRSFVQLGTTIIMTDKPVNGDTQSKPGYKILDVGEVAGR